MSLLILKQPVSCAVDVVVRVFLDFVENVIVKFFVFFIVGGIFACFVSALLKPIALMGFGVVKQIIPIDIVCLLGRGRIGQVVCMLCFMRDRVGAGLTVEQRDRSAAAVATCRACDSSAELKFGTRR